VSMFSALVSDRKGSQPLKLRTNYPLMEFGTFTPLLSPHHSTIPSPVREGHGEMVFWSVLRGCKGLEQTEMNSEWSVY